MTAPTGTALMMAVFVLGIGDVLSIKQNLCSYKFARSGSLLVMTALPALHRHAPARPPLLHCPKRDGMPRGGVGNAAEMERATVKNLDAVE